MYNVYMRYSETTGKEICIGKEVDELERDRLVFEMSELGETVRVLELTSPTWPQTVKAPGEPLLEE